VPAHREARGSRYGFGEWYDPLGPGATAYEVNSPGAFGFLPWLDRSRDLYGVYAVNHQDTDAETTAGGWAVKDEVRAAVDASVPAS
jgi:hypothetical protein